MSKKHPKRSHAKRSNESKRATATPESQQLKPLSAEEYERNYNKNTRRMYLDILIVVLVIIAIYIMVGIDVSGCYLAISEDPTIECTPYSLLEYLTQSGAYQQAQAEQTEPEDQDGQVDSVKETNQPNKDKGAE